MSSLAWRNQLMGTKEVRVPDELTSANLNWPLSTTVRHSKKKAPKKKHCINMSRSFNNNWGRIADSLKSQIQLRHVNSLKKQTNKKQFPGSTEISGKQIYQYLWASGLEPPRLSVRRLYFLPVHAWDNSSLASSNVPKRMHNECSNRCE